MATMTGTVTVDATQNMKDMYVVVKVVNVRQAYIRVRIARILFDIARRIGGYSAVVFVRERRSE